MARITRSLPQLAFTTSAANTQAVGLLDDADAISLFLSTSTGSATATVQVEPTDTGTAFLPLLTASTGAGGVPVVVTTNGAVTITSIGFRQIRLVSTGVLSSATVCAITKQISV